MTLTKKNNFKKGDKVLPTDEEIKHWFDGKPAEVTRTKSVPYPEYDFTVVFVKVKDREMKFPASSLMVAN